MIYICVYGQNRPLIYIYILAYIYIFLNFIYSSTCCIYNLYLHMVSATLTRWLFVRCFAGQHSPKTDKTAKTEKTEKTWNCFSVFQFFQFCSPVPYGRPFASLPEVIQLQPPKLHGNCLRSKHPTALKMRSCLHLHCTCLSLLQPRLFFSTCLSLVRSSLGMAQVAEDMTFNDLEAACDGDFFAARFQHLLCPRFCHVAIGTTWASQCLSAPMQTIPRCTSSRSSPGTLWTFPSKILVVTTSMLSATRTCSCFLLPLVPRCLCHQMSSSS